MTSASNPEPEGCGQVVWRAIAGAARALVVTHANPDADAIASVLAVAAARDGQPTVAAVGDGAFPANLRFLPGTNLLADPRSLDLRQFDLLVVVDCAELSRLGPLYDDHPDWFTGATRVVNIDHHVTNPRFGELCLVDPSAAATCEVLALLFARCAVPISPQTATCLTAGVYGDTLGLKTPSTTSRTLRVCADLLEAGADTLTIVDHLFRLKPYSTVCLWGEVLGRTRRTGPVVWTEITPEMLERSGAVSAEGEGIVNFIAGTEGARAAALCYQQAEGWRVSLRSVTEDVDVAELARLWGGGGHSRAAGCTIPGGRAARDAFIDALAERIDALARPQGPED